MTNALELSLYANVREGATISPFLRATPIKELLDSSQFTFGTLRKNEQVQPPDLSITDNLESEFSYY
jgi:hypothetical protein